MLKHMRKEFDNYMFAVLVLDNNNNNKSFYSPQYYMIIYKQAFFIKILFEMNRGQPAQQELFQASLLKKEEKHD
jgi:hypothetical protein